MTSRIVCFGATGYTGRLTVRSLLVAGARPVLAGRDRSRLEALARELHPDGPEGRLEVAVADATDAASVRAVVEEGDVLLTTVGPFTLHGVAALDAALDAGAHYLDSTGEPAFIRHVFQEAGSRAQVRGITLLTAFGNDWVPGNVAGALAVERAGPGVRAVDIGYFAGPGTGGDGGRRGPVVSTGTRASLLAAMTAPGHAWRAGALRTEPAGRRIKRFRHGDRVLEGVSVGGTEQFCLPMVAPQLRDVDVFLGWFGPASRLVRGFSTVASSVAATSLGAQVAQRLVTAAARRTGQGPSESGRARSGTRILAEARDGGGEVLASVCLEGPVDGYTLTAHLLAWGATELVQGGAPAGAHGPVDAFGLDASLRALASAGLAVVD